MNLKIPSKQENMKSLLINSTTCNLLCICEQRESRLRKGKTRKICGAFQFSWLHFFTPQAHTTFWMLKNSCCQWTRTISNTDLHGDWMNQTNTNCSIETRTTQVGISNDIFIFPISKAKKLTKATNKCVNQIVDLIIKLNDFRWRSFRSVLLDYKSKSEMFIMGL